MRVDTFADYTETGLIDPWVHISGNPASVGTATPRQYNGKGGSRYFRANNGTTRSPSLGYELIEYYGRSGFWKDQASSTWVRQHLNSAGTSRFQISHSGGFLVATDGTVTLGTSASSLADDVWYLIEYYVLHDGTNGVAKVWIDGILEIDYAGAFTGGADGSQFTQHSGAASQYDDYGVNSLSLKYDNEASGPFTVGEVITGGTSGATANITHVIDNGTDGVLVIDNWDGTAFQNNEQITGGTSGATADVDAPTSDYVDGLEPNSGRLGNGFVAYARPNAEGTTIQLTPSTGTDNSANVDDVPPADSTYNYATAANQYDTYTTNASSVLPTVVDSISWVAANRRAKTALTGIDGAKNVIRLGGTDYFSERKALPTALQNDIQTWKTKPDGTGAFSLSDVTGAEAGPQFVA